MHAHDIANSIPTKIKRAAIAIKSIHNEQNFVWRLFFTRMQTQTQAPAHQLYKA